MVQDFQQIEWNDEVEQECRALVRLAVQEDLNGQQDWTTVALVPPDRIGTADVVAREEGIVAGLQALRILLDEMQAELTLETNLVDGDHISAGDRIATIRGNIRDLLTCERPLLNLLARLMGIATMAHQYSAEVAGTEALVYDTRKTTPGWRRLEKYAVQCGGARNHRTGLFDAILIKDNHLAQRADNQGDLAGAVLDARKFLQKHEGPEVIAELPIEIEVDTLEQLQSVLPAGPDIVLLDNMTVETLQKAVAMRDRIAPQVELEASGGVQIETLREIAITGVNRISVGALTHSVRSLDIGLDWKSE